MNELNKMAVKLVEFKAINIFSLRVKMAISDFGQNMSRLYSMILDKKLTITGAPMVFYHDKEFNPENFDAELALPVQEEIEGTRIYPGNQCAMLTLNAAYSELPVVYKKIMQWIEKEDYVVSAAPFEVYLTNPAETQENNNVTEVYIPIASKK